jgi:hypothetical protein
VEDEIRQMFNLAAARISRNPTPENVQQVLGSIEDHIVEGIERALHEANFWSAQVSELEQELATLRGGGKP